MEWKCKICQTANTESICTGCYLKAPKDVASVQETENSNGTAWICPDCGRPNNVDFCAQCGRNFPLRVSFSIDPRDFFTVDHRSKMPDKVSKLVFICIILMLVSAIFAFVYYSFP